MKDPLTMKQIDDYLRSFNEQVKENYQRALRSGAISEKTAEEPFQVLRCALVITAESRKHHCHKPTLSNLRHFI